LELKAFIDGRYDPNTNKQVPTQVKVSIYTQTGGFVDEKNVILDEDGNAMDADGTLGIKFNDFQPDPGSQTYYIVIESMCNAVLKTWSKIQMAMQRGGTYQYDFTTAKNKAYGDNQKEVSPGVWALYNGEVTEDYKVGLDDVLKVYNDAIQFAGGGCCLRTDINGDGGVDLTDLVYVFSYQFVSSIVPFSCPCP
jgi:hypothetical protein